MGDEVDLLWNYLLHRPYSWPFERMDYLQIAWTWWQAMCWVSYAVQLRPWLVEPVTEWQLVNWFRWLPEQLEA